MYLPDGVLLLIAQVVGIFCLQVLVSWNGVRKSGDLGMSQSPGNCCRVQNVSGNVLEYPPLACSKCL